VNASELTGVAWRTDGFWILVWLRIWFYLTSGRSRSFPPKGFVGTVSGSFRGTGPRKCSLLSTRLRRVPSIRSAPHWQLTCEFRIGPRPLLMSRRGFG